MHAVKFITPDVIVVMCIGGIAFVLIFRAIFKDKR
jgi:hypothetical protein